MSEVNNAASLYRKKPAGEGNGVLLIGIYECTQTVFQFDHNSICSATVWPPTVSTFIHGALFSQQERFLCHTTIKYFQIFKAQSMCVCSLILFPIKMLGIMAFLAIGEGPCVWIILAVTRWGLHFKMHLFFQLKKISLLLHYDTEENVN